MESDLACHASKGRTLELQLCIAVGFVVLSLLRKIDVELLIGPTYYPSGFNCWGVSDSKGVTKKFGTTSQMNGLSLKF